jgi:hypothetical protein
VCRGITIANGAIPAARNDFSVAQEHGANRHLTSGRRRASLFERFPHELEIRFHVHCIKD